MRGNKRYLASKKMVSDFIIWLLLLVGVIFMAICPPIGMVCIGCVLLA